MIKKTLLFFATLFLIFSNQVFAHTALKNSTPKSDEVITVPLQEISLMFGTKIEETSNLLLTNELDKSVPFQTFVIEDNQMLANFSKPLDNGLYNVKWKIFGADGHPIEGEYSFTVNNPMEDKATESNQESKKETSKIVEEAQQNAPIEKENPREQFKMPSFIIPSIIGFFFIIIIGTLLWLFRRGKKKC
ncbi:copper resistance CopC family protein [Peribacillus acanthi]|uniref:copper resistance CopC family protein n=1 Tax=Peribacillus acanthi TaxID=2171554 RepID=UPI000D3EBCB4|nr:copper resistance protein CopC [Peribacillus acanthi]